MNDIQFHKELRKIIDKKNFETQTEEIRFLLEDFFQSNDIYNYEISEDLMYIEINQDVDFSNKNFTSLPFFINDISGDFDISNNELTTLEDLPNYIEGVLNCSNNKLTTLKELLRTEIKHVRFKQDNNIPFYEHFKNQEGYYDLTIDDIREVENRREELELKAELEKDLLNKSVEKRKQVKI